MPQRDVLYTVGFAAMVCVVCSVLVSSAAVILAPRQAENQAIDKQRRVLEVSGLSEDVDALSGPEVQSLFERSIEPRLVDLSTGRLDPEGNATEYDARRALKDPTESRVAPSNVAGVRRVPLRAVVYFVVDNGQIERVILPIEGLGLWSTLYGFLAVATDGNTVRGLTYYQHAETPGLGGEVDNPRWKELWPSRKIYDETGRVRLEVIKGKAGPADTDPYRVDGISGATLTGRGVTDMLAFWLGTDAFAPFLEHLRAGEVKP